MAKRRFGFAATGTTVTISALTASSARATSFDFFVDNIHFDEALPTGLNPISTTTGPNPGPGPGSGVPEPATVLLSGIALLGLLGFRRLQHHPAK